MAELTDRASYEADFAAKLNRLSARHRRELIELAGNPPDPLMVPHGFWEHVRQEEEEELLALLLLIFIASATQHGMDATAAESFGNLWAFQRAQEVARWYAETSRETFLRVAGGIAARQPPEAPLEPLGKAELSTEMEVVFGKGRDEGIAITETTEAQTAGAETAVEQTVGQSDEDLWITEADDNVCPICQPLHRTPRSYWGDTIRHFWGSELLYEPPEDGQDPRHGETIDPLWNLFDFTPEGRGTDWYPALGYE